jgi:hypothetical protein
VKIYDPPCSGTADVRSYIDGNLADWVAEACAVRAGFSH